MDIYLLLDILILHGNTRGILQNEDTVSAVFPRDLQNASESRTDDGRALLHAPAIFPLPSFLLILLRYRKEELAAVTIKVTNVVT